MRSLVLVLSVIAVGCRADPTTAPVSVVPCHVCFTDGNCDEHTYVDYNADGIGSACGDGGEGLYDCYLRNPLQICIHSTLAEETPAEEGEQAGTTTQITEVAPFDVDAGGGFVTRVTGALSVVQPDAEYAREVIIHLVDFYTNRVVNKFNRVEGEPGDIHTMEYDLDFRNKGSHTQLYVFFIVHDIELATDAHTFYVVNSAVPWATNCTEEMRETYAETFEEVCFPQVQDISESTHLHYEYSLLSSGFVSDFHFTALPTIHPIYEISFSTKKRDLSLGMIGMAFALALVGTFCMGHGEPYSKSAYRLLSEEATSGFIV
jgi:hypothetical protein